MSYKVLIVEDNPLNMKVISMTLGSCGYTLFEATDGEEALKAASIAKPDLILMDLRLPKIDGLEVTRKLRRMPLFSRTPIIAVTAYAMKGDEERIIDAGCDAYLSKPFNIHQLRNMVAGMLHKNQREWVELRRHSGGD